MNQMVYGYARVSSATQNEDRQMLAMAQMQVPEENIYVDKQSGNGSLTAEQMKNPYRPHKAYIFLSSFLIFYVAICGYVWYNKA